MAIEKCKYFDHIQSTLTIRTADYYVVSDNQHDMDINDACYGTDSESYLLNELSCNRDETKNCLMTKLLLMMLVAVVVDEMLMSSLLSKR